MIHISKKIIKISCPACKSKVEVTFQQVADEITVLCHCGQKIVLQDKDKSAKNAISDINKAFDDLNNSWKNLGK